MRCASSRVFRSAAVLALLVFGVAGRAGAGPLDPLGFTSLGAFPNAPGTYTYSLINGTTPTLSGPGGNFTGVVYSDVPGHQIAVFDFNSINLGSAQSLHGRDPFSAGTAPALALLSQGDITIDGKIDVSAPQPFPPFSRGGPGVFGSGGGPGAGGGGAKVLMARSATPVAVSAASAGPAVELTLSPVIPALPQAM